VLVVYVDGGGLNSRDDRKTTWHETAPISLLSMAIILTTRAWMTCIWIRSNETWRSVAAEWWGVVGKYSY